MWIVWKDTIYYHTTMWTVYVTSIDICQYGLILMIVMLRMSDMFSLCKYLNLNSNALSDYPLYFIFFYFNLLCKIFLIRREQ